MGVVIRFFTFWWWLRRRVIWWGWSRYVFLGGGVDGDGRVVGLTVWCRRLIICIVGQRLNCVVRGRQ